MEPLKQQAQQESRLHFLDYWRIIRIRKTVIIAVFMLVVITATLVTFILPEQFASTATIKIERDKSDIDEMAGNSRISSFDPYFIQTEFEVIQSETILSNVVDVLGLNDKWGKKYNDGQKFKTQESVGILKSRLNLRPRRNTALIDVQVFSENPTDASDLANAVAETYRQWRLEKGQRLGKGGVKALEDQLKIEDEKIAKVKDELDKIRVENKISDVDTAGTAPMMLSESEEFRRYLSSRFEKDQAYKKQKEVFEKLSAIDIVALRDVLPGFQPDSELSSLIGELNAADQKYVSQINDLGPSHPQIQAVNDLRELLNKKIDARVGGILKGLETQVSTAKSELDSIGKAVEDARLIDQDKLTKTRPYFDKKRELEELNDLRRLITRKKNIEEVDLKLPKSEQVVIIEKALASTKAVKPNKTLNIILGVVIGLIVGVGLAFFIEYLDTSVKTIDDVERTLQSPVLGVIPQNVGLLIEEGAESPHAEAYRVLRTNLLFARKDDKLNTTAVVSAGAGEGKSTTVLNLATVFAQSGQRVVIVDSDLRRPTLHKLLKVTNNLGLTNYLLKQNTLDEVIQTTSVPTLDFLASGKLPSSSLGILSSSAMKDLIGELKARYDIVFFDSPPIMGVSDASILASEVDMTVQVIQYRRYPQPMNVRAKQLIEKVGGNLVGIVLNNINMSQDESYYYYSGYYQDYYAKNEDSEPLAEGQAKKPADKKTEGEIKQKY
ncbi:MAG: polysaccharide biosynthesis tyrosine autokinase [Verrucomicrobia bacterium]|jgi:capsular exopolysaccharide synthesis family protein|nr:MAG: polysaccharide biosynthesis tyrosine autokinase [Verrucomicrobiota bacterium]